MTNKDLVCINFKILEKVEIENLVWKLLVNIEMERLVNVWATVLDTAMCNSTTN